MFLKDVLFFNLLFLGFFKAPDDDPEFFLFFFRNHHALKDPEINMLIRRACIVPSAIDQSSF